MYQINFINLYGHVTVFAYALIMLSKYTYLNVYLYLFYFYNNDKKSLHLWNSLIIQIY